MWLGTLEISRYHELWSDTLYDQCNKNSLAVEQTSFWLHSASVQLQLQAPMTLKKTLRYCVPYCYVVHNISYSVILSACHVSAILFHFMKRRPSARTSNSTSWFGDDHEKAVPWIEVIIDNHYYVLLYIILYNAVYYLMRVVCVKRYSLEL
jgi:hypothetical protein